MPQDSTAFLVFYKDTIFSVSSMEEYNNLPDSLKQPEVLDQVLIQLNYKKDEPVIYRTVQTEDESPVPPMFSGIFLFTMVLGTIWLINYFNKKSAGQQDYDDYSQDYTPISSHLTYHGKDLNFSREEIRKSCLKYNSFFQSLSIEKQNLFIYRLRQFIHEKDFHIHAAKGYKEMPILISAAAIQITFGLEEYLLPHFSNIIVHEEEYFGLNPLRVLVGNVQGNSISLSWKHFLEDYQNPTDGKNVGLHEMAHALQVQFLFQNSWKRNEFKEDFDHYDRIDDEILHTEKISPSKLFNENALSNKNEFWATSVELFFEKPAALKQFYPKLYSSISAVLNQHTIPS
jgi:hypothetical protein